MSPDDATPTGHGLSSLLRDARTRAGLELDEVSTRTHVRASYLEALENEDFAALPEDVYARNFLRLYARAVGIDVQDALTRYDAAKAAQHGPPASGQAHAQADAQTARPSPSGEAPANNTGEVGSTPPQDAAPRRARRSAAPRRDTGRARAMVRQVGPLLMTLVLAGALVGLAVWGFNELLFQPSGPVSTPTAEEGQEPQGADGNGVPDASAEDGPAAPALPGGDALPDEVLFSVTSDPPGAEVTVDAFPLPGTTPIEDVPVTAREARTVRVTREGYQPFEDAVDLSTDRSLSVTLTPESEAEGGSEGAIAAGDPSGVVVIVNEASWLEAYQSTSRGEGERLAYTTAQPGERFEFSRPVYLHVGNAGGLEVIVDGESIGALGSGGAVTGEAFPAP
ncbi:MAG: DUF4115 domain-containing protein [Trueperaceae bacterium]|nr:DUF4115 domain-containing protein [Trueperaceae bacterium]